MRYPTLHLRCGTSFIMSVLLLTGRPESAGVRVGSRHALIPVVASISYVIRFASKHRGNKLVDLAIAPGLLLQRLTAREPEADQLRVALAALKELLSMGGRDDPPEAFPHLPQVGELHLRGGPCPRLRHPGGGGKGMADGQGLPGRMGCCQPSPDGVIGDVGGAAQKA